MEAQTTQAQAPQVFAAKGRSRRRAMRIALAIGGGLVVAWVAALALGAFGGFDTLPQVNLKADDPKEQATPAPAETAAPAAAQATEAGATQQQAATPRSDEPTGGGGAAPVRKPSKPAPTPAPAPQPTGKPEGAGSTDGTGKPIGTPGNGSTGSNAGGNGNGNGQLK
jgi:hypothetical protein